MSAQMGEPILCETFPRENERLLIGIMIGDGSSPPASSSLPQQPSSPSGTATRSLDVDSMLHEILLNHVNDDDGILAGVDNGMEARRRNAAADEMSSITGEQCFENALEMTRMTRNRKPLSSWTVYGRDEESSLIQDLFCRVQQQQQQLQPQQQRQLPHEYRHRSLYSPSQVLLVRGPSGSGKTKLVQASLGRYATYQHGGYFVEGKFNQYQRTGEIYSALAAALSDLCELLVSTSTAATAPTAQQQPSRMLAEAGDASIDTLRDTLRQQLGSDAKKLTMLVPGLYHLLPELRTNLLDEQQHEEQQLQQQHDNSNWDGQQAFTRLQHLCIDFLGVIATPQRPLAIFLDDLQWADDASMKLIIGLVCSSKLSHILWIASFRDDNNDYVSAMDGFIAAVQFGSHTNDNDTVFPLTVLEVGNLDLEGTSKIVEAWTKPSFFDSGELSRIVHRKTNGNPYFLEQFIKLLQRERMLELHDGRWTWDMDRIRNETDIADNVVDLVTQRIQKLSENAQQVLQLAAFLGYMFEVDVLQVLTEEWLGWKPSMSVATELQSVLKRAVSSGLLEQISDNEYKFSHDRVQQCLFALVEERTLFHYMIGMALYREWSEARSALDPSVVGNLLLLATDHLNQGRDAIQDSREKLGLVRLNQEASQWSIRQCAFGAALAYLRRGNELLGDDEAQWKNHYELCLQVNTSLGYLEISNGNHDAGEARCHAVFYHATCLDDKLDAYSTLVQSLGRQEGKLLDSIELGKRVLRMLGAPLPKKVRMCDMIVEMTRTRRIIASMTDAQLLRLPPIVDKKQLAVIKIMHKTGWVAFSDGNSKLLLGLTMVVLMRMTCRYGYTEWTPAIVARYGGLEATLGNFKTARRLFGISVKLIDEAKSKASKCRATLNLHGLLSQWFEPYSRASDGFCRTYAWGIESGEFEMALNSASQYLLVAMHSRLGLMVVESEARTFCQQARDFNVESILVLMLPFWQTVLNLTGESEDPAKLTGEAMVEEELEEKLSKESNGLVRQVFVSCRLGMSWHFGDWETTEHLCDVAVAGNDAYRGHFAHFQAVFLEGLLSFIMLERECTPKRKYLRRTRKASKQVHAWAKLGVPDCQATAKFLAAEQMVLNDKGHKRGEEVMKLYEEALDAAGQLGSLQFEALFSERIFEVLLNVYGDDDRALTYLCKSIDLYADWQAHAKVQQLDDVRRNLLRSSP